MDAMKDALKSKMMSMKKGPMMPMDQEAPGVKDGEMAPSLESADLPDLDADDAGGEISSPGVDPSLMDAAQKAVGPDVLTQILTAIADSSAGSGGNPNTLGGRSAMGAQAKLDMMKK